MTYNDLVNVNAKLKTTDIKGKAYTEVNERIKAFRMLFPNGCIQTDLLINGDGICIIKATVLNEEGFILATGIAYEKEGSSFINKTSYIENCETSAVGRALGMLGIGIDTSVASFEEVGNAIQQQNDSALIDEHTKMVIKSLCDETATDIDKMLGNYNVDYLDDLTMGQANNAIAILNKKRNKK